ncbi:MAG: hypothetical protein CMQ05_03250 [Gammaproteobacteria bacterium]|mgnify:CR=1|uniref:Uncharacterized protein n=1 Tax=OM182 bacterium MED-G24 TaxID=1986255 RepID=A0A2A5WNP6_9GAMM|nr:hypothetical protein [Gammaproteobacteria bacterium]PDH37867.1 MAG: hypothetical protein CNE99_07660 [OM182 bacterium MED-G24]|tara:strand:- start:1543 stop:1746 length:204 start_codon:yes stop_codon:yes gene_type:complete
MKFVSVKPITLIRATTILFLGIVCGIQLGLYMFDYYDDGIAEFQSLVIGLIMVLCALAFVVLQFRSE